LCIAAAASGCNNDHPAVAVSSPGTTYSVTDGSLVSFGGATLDFPSGWRELARVCPDAASSQLTGRGPILFIAGPPHQDCSSLALAGNYAFMERTRYYGGYVRVTKVRIHGLLVEKFADYQSPSLTEAFSPDLGILIRIHDADGRAQGILASLRRSSG